MDNIGVIHGRFQGLHLGHMEYILSGKKRCNHLIIGICNPSISQTHYDSSAPHRSLKLENPFTYYERYEMIKLSLMEYGVPKDDFDIVPFPINIPDEICNYVPVNATFYLTIYDNWGVKKLSTLKRLGFRTEVMWYRTSVDKITSGTEVRKLIRNEEKWKNLVPNSVYKYILENKLDERLRKNIRNVG